MKPRYRTRSSGYHLYYNNPFSQRVIPGWYQKNLIFALDLGQFPLTPDKAGASPVYIPITGFDHNNFPLPVEGQYYIFTQLPTTKGYTGFCQVHFLLVPRNYRSNSLQSVQDVTTSHYELLMSDLILLLPIL